MSSHVLLFTDSIQRSIKSNTVGCKLSNHKTDIANEMMTDNLKWIHQQTNRQEDRSHSFNCACSNKEETGRAHPAN